jgi:hypothetical protein
MKKFTHITLLLVIATLAWLSFPTAVHAQGSDAGQIIFGGTYNLHDGETLEGGLVIFGGQGILDEGSVVNGDIFIAGGTLDVSGEVNGNITATGGTVILQDSGTINGNIDLIGAGFRNNGATVDGEITQNESLDFNFLNVPPVILPHLIPEVSPGVTPNFFQTVLKPMGDFLWNILRALAIAALAALIVLLLPNHTERLAKSINMQPVLAGGMGMLTLIVAPALLVLLLITILLIPVGILGILVLTLAALFGWVAVGYEVGKRMAVLFKQSWTPVVCGGLGTLALNFVCGILGIVPCFGWILPTLVVIIGLGGVLISRFGTRVYGNGSDNHPPAPEKVSPALYDVPLQPLAGNPAEPSAPPSEIAP